MTNKFNLFPSAYIYYFETGGASRVVITATTAQNDTDILVDFLKENISYLKRIKNNVANAYPEMFN